MAHYRLDTNVAGAFLNLYRPIGNDPVVKSLEPDYDYVPKQEPCPHQFVSLDEIIAQVDAGEMAPSADPVFNDVKRKPRNAREEMQYRIEAIMTTYRQQPELQRCFRPLEYLRIRLKQYEYTYYAAK